MGGKCNSSYKLTQDVIRDGHGQRRRCFDPYGQDHVQISLLESRPFEGNIIDLVRVPAWKIDFIGEKEATETWNEVFKIRQRYESKVDAHFKDWIEDFSHWCVRAVGLVEDRCDVILALDKYISEVVYQPIGEAAHLKRSMFEMMLRHCREDDDTNRLARWFSDQIRNHQELHELVVG